MAKMNVRFLLLVGLVMGLVVSSCKKTDCSEVICQPCPSSRIMIQYQDSTGACPAAFHANAMVHAFNVGNYADTLYSYNFADSCATAFIADTDKEYHIVSGTFRDTLVVGDLEYQDPVEVTECCLCYPAAHAHVMWNGVEQTINFPSATYDSNPLVVNLN